MDAVDDDDDGDGDGDDGGDDGAICSAVRGVLALGNGDGLWWPRDCIQPVRFSQTTRIVCLQFDVVHCPAFNFRLNFLQNVISSEEKDFIYLQHLVSSNVAKPS